jgi:tetratricopeptide (TPR) repeat protein
VNAASRGFLAPLVALGVLGIVGTIGAVALPDLRIAQSAPSPRRQVQALLDAGRYEDAERVARNGGAALLATLGDVHRARGRLAAADSAYRAAAVANNPGRRVADIGLAELEWRRGARDSAWKRDPSRWTSDDRTSAARAYLLLGSDAKWVRSALATLDDAVAADSSNIDAMIRIGDLFLDKYNAPDARESYNAVLRRAPNNARALLGVARVLEFQDSASVGEAAQRALNANPAYADAFLFFARGHLEAESYDSASAYARKALNVDSTSVSAWAILGAGAWIRGDSNAFRAARASAERLNARPAEFYAELADAAVRNRRYADAVQLARQAVALDTSSVRALAVLGTNLMRTGDLTAGRAALERAFALDPYNIWQKNTLDLLDEMAKFRTIDRGRFRFVAPAAEAELIVTYLSPLLEEAFDTLSKRYAYTPPTPIRIELFRRHADFSVRTVGLAGLGALGVSFGTTLAMDAPSARDPGTFNYGSTSWHELAHTFTLGKSEHRVPRWFSEGLSVFEERRARAGWGANVSVDFLAAYKGGQVRKVSELNDGFVRPRYPAELGFSYITASLVCEMIYADRGASAFAAMLIGYRDGFDTPNVVRRVYGESMEAFDKRFDDWFRKRYASPLAVIEPGDGRGEPSGKFILEVLSARALLQTGRLDSARAALLRAQEMFPEYGGADGPAWYIAQIEAERGNLRGAIDQAMRITSRNETALEANDFEAQLRERLGDFPGAAAALERMLWIAPNDPATHARLADVAARAGDHTRAVRERRAIIAMGPADLLEARYQLARALAASGDVAAARREVLAIIERAPGFEKAQTLLLELRGRAPRSAPR